MLSAQQQQQIIAILRHYQPVRIGIFGSRARGDHRPDSDLDVLIRLQEHIGLLKLVQLEQELSDVLGIRVDLVTEGAVKNALLRQYIENDLIPIYETVNHR
ncbi:MAG: nucleotidyltransferase family protein [Saprospiraceae bacterium]|nr:nucleotidyltransferase family protein [Saprospiraceae bacterium]